MHVTARVDYALQAMLALAHTENEPVPSKALADMLDLSYGYLLPIVNELRRAGLVRLIRGDGFLLARRATDITLDQIIWAIDCPLTMTDGSRLDSVARDLDAYLPTLCSLSSPALLTRMLAAELRTVLIDEADRSLNPEKNDIDDLLAVLNSGYKRGATRPVLMPGKGGNWEPAEMPTFAPVAMAGNSPQLPEDTRTRTIRVLLPDLDGRVEESDWELIEDDAAALAGKLADWADQIREQVRIFRPPLPDGIIDRFRESGSRSKRVAAAAGGRWPGIVDSMALHDKEQYGMDKEDGLIRERPAVLLLKHIREAWPAGEVFVATSDLRRDLIEQHPAVWDAESPYGKPLTAQRLGRMLAGAYKINSSRQSNTGPRGYLWVAFVTVWSRMGIDLGQEPAHTAELAELAQLEPEKPEKPDKPVPSNDEGPLSWEALLAKPRTGSGTVATMPQPHQLRKHHPGGAWCQPCLDASRAYTARLDAEKEQEISA